MLVAFVLSYGWLISAQAVHYSRDALPLLPALAVIGAIGLATLTAWLRRFFGHRMVVIVAAGLVVAALIPPIMASADVPQSLAEHPRREAQAWITKHVKGGSTVVVEAYGPWIPPGKYHLVEVPAILGNTAVPSTAAAIVVTENESGRFLADPTASPAKVAQYRRLARGFWLGASYNDGPWVRVFVPCPK